MRRIPVVIALAASLALAACGAQAPPGSAGSTAPPVDNTAPQNTTPAAATAARGIVDTVTIKATQGLILAELAYNTAGNGLKAAVTAGLIKPGSPLALRLRDLNDTASRALEVARTARSAAEQAAATARAMSAIVSLRQATPAVKE